MYGIWTQCSFIWHTIRILFEKFKYWNIKATQRWCHLGQASSVREALLKDDITKIPRYIQFKNYHRHSTYTVQEKSHRSNILEYTVFDTK